MGKLDGKVAVVTGGTSGIGLASARRLATEGAHVFITGRRKPELDAAVKAIGSRATGVQGDVANLADLDRLYAVVKEQKGRVDVLFANAGGGELAPLGAITEEHFDKTFNSNVKGLLFTVQKALPLLSDGASIILNASITSSKGRVNAISPGPIDTPGLGSLGDDLKKGLAGAVPMGRLGSPDEIAKAVVFLASDDSSYVTGIELFVDGGMAQV